MEVILFDGVCNLCNSSVNWIIRHDTKNRFKFASLQSAYGRQSIARFQLTGEYLNTVVLLDNEQIYLRAKAVLRILNHLGCIYSLAAIFNVIPSPILNFFYNIVAKYRYRWFGKRDTCMVPDVSLKQKFIE